MRQSLSIEAVVGGTVELRSMDSSRCADRCRSATKARVPRELVGECAAGCTSLVRSGEARSMMRGTFSDVEERLFTMKVLCDRWQLLTVDIDEKRECVVDCKEDIDEERLLRLELDLCLDDAPLTIWLSDRESWE